MKNAQRQTFLLSSSWFIFFVIVFTCFFFKKLIGTKKCAVKNYIKDVKSLTCTIYGIRYWRNNMAASNATRSTSDKKAALTRKRYAASKAAARKTV